MHEVKLRPAERSLFGLLPVLWTRGYANPTPFELNRTDVSDGRVPADGVVEPLNVVEHVRPRFVLHRRPFTLIRSVCDPPPQNWTV